MLKALPLFLLTVAGLFLFSCGGDEPAPAAGEPAASEPTTETAFDGNAPMDEVDIRAEAPELRIGYVNQDHHAAVFVSALCNQMMHDMYPVYLVPLGEEYYALIKNDEKVAEIEFVQSQGAINVPNNMQAGLFEMGFGGVVPFAAAMDQGNPIRIIAPLHQRGDMLVVAADNQEVNDWEGFIRWVESSVEPVTVGYKSPKAVALIIFQSALAHAGVSYAMAGGDIENAGVILYNAQGQPNLNPALQEGLIDAYVSNNPACALAEHNGIGRCVAELSLLPPGDFENHPCCAIAATEAAIAASPEEIAAALELFAYATEFINEYPEEAASAAAEWIGTPVEVERASMSTSLYDMKVTGDWLGNMGLILDHMRGLGSFTGFLADTGNDEALERMTDFTLLPEGCR